METGDLPLVVDEYVIEPEPMPDRYKARLAIRYSRDTFVQALAVAQDFLRTKFDALAVSGASGSPNEDQITVWFWAARRTTLTEQFLSAGPNQPRI